MKKILKELAETLLVFALNWASAFVINYLDADKDGKVSAKEIRTKLNPSAKKLVSYIK